MRATAEVGEVALGIGGDGTVFQVLVNVLALEGLTCCAKQLQGISLGHFLAHHGFLLGSQFLHLLFDGGEITLADLLAVGQQHIIVETVFDGRTEAELDARIEFLQRLGQQMGTGVPEGVLALLILKFVEHKLSVLVDGAVQLHCLAVHSAAHHATCQSRRNTLGNLITRHTRLALEDGAIGECNVNHISVCVFFYRGRKGTTLFPNSLTNGSIFLIQMIKLCEFSL